MHNSPGCGKKKTAYKSNHTCEVFVINLKGLLRGGMVFLQKLCWNALGIAYFIRTLVQRKIKTMKIVWKYA